MYIHISNIIHQQHQHQHYDLFTLPLSVIVLMIFIFIFAEKYNSLGRLQKKCKI